MYKITKKYTDFNGVEKEEDFYFNLSKADILIDVTPLGIMTDLRFLLWLKL
jgi:hypothetical protein